MTASIIQMISNLRIKISVVIDEKYLEAAVRGLHKPPLAGCGFLTGRSTC